MENISIRKVIEKDADFLFSLMNNESVLDSLSEIGTSLETWEVAVSEWNNDVDEEDYVILDNDIPIGWLAINNLTSQEKQAFVKMIAILPHRQGLGIGTYVINRIIQNLKLRGYESIALYTDQNNVKAQNCYKRCGFVIIDTMDRKMPNGKYIPRYKMELKLK